MHTRTNWMPPACSFFVYIGNNGLCWALSALKWKNFQFANAHTHEFIDFILSKKQTDRAAQVARMYWALFVSMWKGIAVNVDFICFCCNDFLTWKRNKNAHFTQATAYWWMSLEILQHTSIFASLTKTQFIEHHFPLKKLIFLRQFKGLTFRNRSINLNVSFMVLFWLNVNNLFDLEPNCTKCREMIV